MSPSACSVEGGVTNGIPPPPPCSQPTLALPPNLLTQPFLPTIPQNGRLCDLKRQPEVGVRDKLPRHVGNREMLLMVLQRLGQFGGALHLQRDADAVARERLAHHVPRLQACA